ncbi:hypothetical protein JTB14_032745 [Gonioctena quinquepunctata]|nr:hypothetical protein JTB14_032745 [Gonioctena quinquepunctata]
MAEGTDFQDIQVHWYLPEDKHGSLLDIDENILDSPLESDAPKEELGAEIDSLVGYMNKIRIITNMNNSGKRNLIAAVPNSRARELVESCPKMPNTDVCELDILRENADSVSGVLF